MTLMDGDSPWPVLILFCLLAGAVYFALAETAFASVNRIRVKTRAERGSRRAEKALYVLDHFDKAITTILIGTNIMHLTVGSCRRHCCTGYW